MKVRNKIGIVLLSCVCSMLAEAPFQPYWPHARYQAQTCMFTRPIFENISAWQALWHRLSYGMSCAHGWALQCMPMYQQAETTEKNIFYWLLDCKNHLLFSGDANKNDYADRDVRAEWFQLPSTFRGQMTVSPRQRQAGFLLELYKDLTGLSCKHCLRDCWVSVELPISYVENDMQLTQWNIQNPSETFPHDIRDAFCNPSWSFLKICGARKTVQPAYINVRFGKNFYDHCIGTFLCYAGLTIPTSSTQNPSFMFSPVAGYNGHFGIIAGMHGQLFISSPDRPYVVCFFAELENIFLVHARQQRTFDLVCNPWSRYLLYVKKNGLPQAYTPGVNVLTRNVRVHPFSYVDFACGFRITSEWFESEIGYGIWVHGNEKIELTCGSTCPENNEYGIAGCAPEGYSSAVTASKSTIKNQASYDRDALGNPVFIPVTDNQLDLLSACSRSVLNHKIFVSIGRVQSQSVGYTFGMGTYVEIPQWGTSLQSWGVWAKGGLAF